MKALVLETERACEGLCTEFLGALYRGALDNMQWVYQLQVQCERFIHLLSVAARLCDDPLQQEIRRKHFRAERAHPEQLRQWMTTAGLDPQRPWRPTLEQTALIDFLTDITVHGTSAEQVLILNVLSERLAWLTFRALLRYFGRTKLHGTYWQEHEDVDQEHAKMGVAELPQHVVDLERPVLQQRLKRGLFLYDRAINSWAWFA